MYSSDAMMDNAELLANSQAPLPMHAAYCFKNVKKAAWGRGDGNKVTDFNVTI